jgi:hypothetical protein
VAEKSIKTMGSENTIQSRGDKRNPQWKKIHGCFSVSSNSSEIIAWCGIYFEAVGTWRLLFEYLCVCAKYPKT